MRTRIARSGLHVLLICALGLSAGAANDARPAVELLQLVGVADGADDSLRYQLDRLRKQNPAVPHDFWRGMYKKHSGGGPLLNGLAPVVERHFDAREIRTLLEFYRSPVGKKLRAFRLDLAEQGKAIARPLSDGITGDIHAELRAAGYIE